MITHDAGDLRAVIAHLARLYPRAPLVAVGYSLGANILVKYLGEEGPRTPLIAAASLCNPFNLVRFVISSAVQAVAAARRC